MTDGPRPGDTPNEPTRVVSFELNGSPIEVADDGDNLLNVLRGRLGVRSAKDGCSPQGQCGCCTVLVDGQPRVACVTPIRRVRGRRVETLEGLAEDDREAWAHRFAATGASQCGFCTPGIIMRLEGLRRRGTTVDDLAAVDQALLAHLCRCTGWQTIREAWGHSGEFDASRDLAAAARRAELEGGAGQVVGTEVALGRAPFAADTAPAEALVAVLDPDGQWVTGASVAEARARAGTIQGRRTTAATRWPIEVPEGDWDLTLQTTWVEPAYLETDASWCRPGEEPRSPLANGGAFGAKAGPSAVTEAAARLAAEHNQPVLALFSREDTVRRGPKRPPVAAGVRRDGSGVIRLASPTDPGDVERLTAATAAVAPRLRVEYVAVPGPPVSASIRAAGWAEAAALVAGATAPEGPITVTAPNGAVATAVVTADSIAVSLRCGAIGDRVVLRSYCIGAAHMAYSWVRSESLSVDDTGAVGDLTVRSFGVVRAVDTPAITVELLDDDGPAVNGSDAVFAAVAGATWRAHDYAPAWPVMS